MKIEITDFENIEICSDCGCVYNQYPNEDLYEHKDCPVCTLRKQLQDKIKLED